MQNHDVGLFMDLKKSNQEIRMPTNNEEARAMNEWLDNEPPITHHRGGRGGALAMTLWGSETITDQDTI